MQMAQFVVRNLDEDVKAALQGLGSRMASRFAAVGLDGSLPELQGEQIMPMRFDC